LALEIGGLAQAALKVIHQAASIADRQLPLGDRRFAGHAQPLQQQLGVVLHRLQHLGIGVAAHHVIHPVAASGGQADMHRIGAAEQVVQVAHHLLVGAGQKQADPVGFAGAQGVELQQALHLAPPGSPIWIDEAGQLAVGIAGEVSEAAQPAGGFIEALQG